MFRKLFKIARKKPPKLNKNTETNNHKEKIDKLHFIKIFFKTSAYQMTVKKINRSHIWTKYLQNIYLAKNLCAECIKISYNSMVKKSQC